VEHRIKTVLATLKGLREPEYLGEVLNIPLKVGMENFSVKDSEPRDAVLTYLTVKA
jgi:hypothetical protein